MIWIVLALLHSVFRAAFVETSRVFGDDRRVGAFLQALFGFVFLLPAVFFVPWPVDLHFYLAATGVALIFTIGTLIQLELSAQKSGRVSSMYMPLEALIAAIIWILIFSPAWQDYLSHPALTGGIALGFIIASVALLKLRPQDVSWQSFLLVAPIGITYAIAGVVTKIALPETMLPSMAITFVIVNFAVMALILGLALGSKRKLTRRTFSGRALATGLGAGLLSALAFGSFVMGVAYAPNPGYISAVVMLLPVWLLAWHKARGIEDRADIKTAALVVVGLALLLVMALKISY